MKLLQIFAILATLLICKPALATPAVYFGAYVNPEGLSVQKSDIDDCSRTVRQMAAFKSLTGTYPTYAHCWINNGVVDPKDPGKFPIDSLNKMYALGITPVLNVRCDTPARLLAGADDVYYRNFAKAAAAFGHPILFRGTGWEFNISDIHSCNTQSNPAGFVAGWQHIHDIFVQEGATNVLWAWVPAAPRVPAAVLPFYPGDVYVDRIMFDH